MKAPLQEKYEKEITKVLEKELGVKNKLALPRLLKVSINVGIGSEVAAGNKDYSGYEQSLSEITGQKPFLRKARIAVSNFKLRKGMPVGLTTTLRGEKMYNFVDRLVNIALPRVRDFRGISIKGFDRKGNFCLGLKDCTIFPEVDQENLSKAHGFQVNVCTSAKTDREAYVLLKALGFPFKDEVKAKNKES